MNKHKSLQIYCPTCYKPVPWDENSRYRPFCSKRCQLIDLGSWANEDNKIASQSTGADDLESDEPEWSRDKDTK